MSIKTNTTDLQLIIDKLNAIFSISISNAISTIDNDILITTGNSISTVENDILMVDGSAKAINKNDILKVTNT